MRPKTHVYTALPLRILAVLALTPFAAGAQSITFSDVSAEAGISFVHDGPGISDKFQGTGAAWFDFELDGDLDLYVTRRIGSNTFYRNDGGVFTDVTNLYGIGDSQHDGSGVSVADYNNDGYPDLYLANSDGDVLYRNDKGNGFVNVTSFSGIDIMGDGRGTTASWGDYDNDGFLDLYVTNHEHVDRTPGMSRDYLMHYNGDGTFTDVSHYFADVDRDGYGFAATWTDIDDDADLDLLLVNDCDEGPRPVRLFRNDGPDGAGGWTFTEASELWGCNRCDAGMGVAIGDYDRDGRLDYFYSDIGNPILLHNEGGAFRVSTGEAGINIGVLPGTVQGRWTWGANFYDFDLDGWVDLYVASGEFRRPSTVMPSRNVMLRNLGDGTFEDVSEASGADDPDRTRTTVVGDYDNDGDPDIFVVNYTEPARLYRNGNDNGNHFLIVDLEGVVSNREGIGARLRLRMPDGSYQYAETHAGTSLGGGDDRAAYFGLGTHSTVDEMMIRWPSGIVQRLEAIAGDQRMRVVEDTMTTVPQIGDVTVNGGVTEARVGWTSNYQRDAVRYEVQVFDGGAFAAVAEVPADGTTLRPGDFAVVIDGLDPGEQTFRVRLVTGGGDELSAPVTATVLPPAASLSEAIPNPFSSSTRFDLTVDATQRVRVEIYDVAGRFVGVLFEGTVAAGASPAITFDGAGRASGIYLVRAKGETFSAERKVLLIR